MALVAQFHVLGLACFSETTNGIIRAFFLPKGDFLSFSMPEGTGNIAGFWFARGDQNLG